MASSTRRVVLLGKTGDGKSSTANTMFGEKKVFQINHTANSETSRCKSETRSVNGREITLIDTPGFFDTAMSEKLRSEILRCVIECAPGPHAFLILQKVGKITKHEKEVISEIKKSFSNEAFRYATVVFTHGDQLPEDMTIQDFVDQNKDLKDLVSKCGGRCHVIDNKYWNDKQPGDYRSNQVQVAEILNTIDKMVEGNGGGHYTNEMLEMAERDIQEKEEEIRKSSPNMSEEGIRRKAIENTWRGYLISFAGVATGALLGALLGVVSVAALGVGLPLVVAGQIPVGITAVMKKGVERKVGVSATTCKAALTVGGGIVTVAAAAGGIVGGVSGYNAAKEANTPGEAASRAAEAVWSHAENIKDCFYNKATKEGIGRGVEAVRSALESTIVSVCNKTLEKPKEQ